MSQAFLALAVSLALGSPVLPWVLDIAPWGLQSASEEAGSLNDPNGAPAAVGGEVDPHDAPQDAGGVWDPNG